MFQRRRANRKRNRSEPPIIGRTEHCELTTSRSRSLSPQEKQQTFSWKEDEVLGIIEDRANITQENPTRLDPNEIAEDNASTTSGSSSSASSSSSDGLGRGGPLDMKFSLASNLLFFAGASIQTIVSSWDVRDATVDAQWDVNHPDDEGDDDDDFKKFPYFFYFILNSVGPFLYALNALVDAKWSLTLTTIEHPLAVTTYGHCGLLVYAWKKKRAQNNNNDDMDEVASLEEEMEEEVNEKLYELLVATIFGLGALLEFVSTLFDFGNDSDKGSLAANRINVVSMHLYLLSGLLHLHKDRRLILHPGGSKASVLMGCGMILFLSGSILDCIISYLYDPDLVSDKLFTPLQLACYNLVSTLLWNVNAIFFICADCLIYDIWSQARRYRTLPQSAQSQSSRLGEPPGSVSLPLLVVGNPRATKTGHVG